MALLEESVIDPRLRRLRERRSGRVPRRRQCRAGKIDVGWIDEDDPYVSPMGAKGVGEIGIVGAAAAVTNAVHHATGVRVRDLPITLDKLLRT